MAELQETYGKYPGFYPEWIEQDGQWVKTGAILPMSKEWLVPDSILDALKDAAAPIIRPIFEKHLAMNAEGGLVPPLNRHRILINDPSISMKKTKELVAAAFGQFDPKLGEWAQKILDDPTRIELTRTDPGEADGYCEPPGWQGRVTAKIFYQYDGTINDAVYLAHELGHLLSNDLAQAAGYQGKDNPMPKHVAELPAMFMQIALYDHLINGQNDPTLQKVGRQHFAGEMTRQIYFQQVAFAMGAAPYPTEQEYASRIAASLGENWNEFYAAKNRPIYDSGSLHRHMSASTMAAGFYFSGLGKETAVFDAIFKKGKDSDIMDILKAANITTTDQLSAFMSHAVKENVKPIEEIDFSAASRPDQSARPGKAARPS